MATTDRESEDFAPEIIPKRCILFNPSSGHGCPEEFATFTEVIEHCRRKHPDKIPYTFHNIPPGVTIGITDSGDEATDVQIDDRLNHPLFWRDSTLNV